MIAETLFILSSQLLLYLLPQVNWSQHWFLWLIPPLISGIITRSFKDRVISAIVSSILYIFIAGSLEGIKILGSMGYSIGVVFGFIYGFPILLTINVIMVLVGYGIKALFT